METLLSSGQKREIFSRIARASMGAKVSLGDSAYAQRLAFALSRYDEGERTVALLERLFPELMARRPLAVLDLGSGNGGMLFPFAGRGRLLALDVYIDPDLRDFARAASTGVVQILGRAHRLPFADESLDVIVLAEVIEHLREPRRAGREIARVLRPGGVCLVSTPPRLKFMLRPDPHYGIRCLLLFPDFLQRFIARAWFKRQDYDVDHIYATSFGVRRQFPRRDLILHVISHRKGWSRHLSWNYFAFEKKPAPAARRAA